jgi:hypothetical protein
LRCTSTWTFPHSCQEDALAKIRQRTLLAARMMIETKVESTQNPLMDNSNYQSLEFVFFELSSLRIDPRYHRRPKIVGRL